MGESLGIPFMLDAIRAALRIMAGLPECEETETVVREAYSLRETVESWRDALPGPVAREATMQRVLRLHVQAANCARKVGGLPQQVPVPERESVAIADGTSAGRNQADADTGRSTIPPPFDMEAFAREATAPDSTRRVPSDPAAPDPAQGERDPPSSARTLRPASFPPSSVRRAAAALDEAVAGSIDQGIAEMLDAVTSGEHEHALELAERILRDAPSNPIALVCREQCLSALERHYRDRFGSLDRVPVVVRDAHAGRLTLDHRTGFILSLIDGVTSVEALLDVCATPPWVALRILVELVEEGVIALQ